MSFKKAFTFDDVALVPQYNNISSRTHPKLHTHFTQNVKVDIPIICSNMDTAIGDEMADALLENGSMPIFHRFTDFAQQKAWAEKYGEKCFLSCGIQKLTETQKLLDLGVKGICVDVAHGHSSLMFDFIEKIKKSHPEVEVIAGNVCTAMAYHDLVNAGADAVKVGIGPGAACSTRRVTGFGVPQFSAIYECAQVAQKLRVPLIADGGIRNSRDVVLALAAGASTVMMGKLFALTKESPTEKKEDPDRPGHFLAKYRGQASEDFQKDYYGGLKEKTVAEGVDFWAPVSGSVEQLLDNLLGGLRSGLTYGGASTIRELQRKAEFVEVTSHYGEESKPRPAHHDLKPLGK